MDNQQKNEYFSGQGKVFIDGFWVGNVPVLQIGTEVNEVEHKESYSGQRAVDFTVTKDKKVTFKAELESISSENLAIAFGASIAENDAAKIADEVLFAKIPVLGQMGFLKRINVTNVVLKDSAAAPTTLKEGEHYEIDLKFGRITMLKVEGLTGEIKATYNAGKNKQIKLLDKNVTSYNVRFEGLNTANSDEPVLIEMPNVKISPAKTFDLINDDFAKLELEGTVLAVGGTTVVITKI